MTELLQIAKKYGNKYSRISYRSGQQTVFGCEAFGILDNVIKGIPEKANRIKLAIKCVEYMAKRERIEILLCDDILEKLKEQK